MIKHWGGVGDPGRIAFRRFRLSAAPDEFGVAEFSVEQHRLGRTEFQGVAILLRDSRFRAYCSALSA